MLERRILIGAATLAGSCVFFVVTNFAFWAESGYYPPTTEGLLECYTAALPFFRNSVLGDLDYACILFGVWALTEAPLPALHPASAPGNP